MKILLVILALVAGSPDSDGYVDPYKPTRSWSNLKLRSACYGKLGDSGVLSVSACARLGRRYMTGRGAKKDPALAETFLELACADQPQSPFDPGACVQLGGMLYRGDEIPQDYPRAIRILRRACDAASEASACSTLGHMVTRGLGIESDPLAGAMLFDRACKLGWRQACKRG